MDKRNELTPPVREGDILDVNIVSMGSKGDGIAKLDKFVIMVKDTQIGDNVRVKIYKCLAKMAFAEKVEE